MLRFESKNVDKISEVPLSQILERILYQIYKCEYISVPKNSIEEITIQNKCDEQLFSFHHKSNLTSLLQEQSGHSLADRIWH